MATKAKSSATPNSASAKGHENPLGDKLNTAMELFQGGRFQEAQTALDALLGEARKAEHFGMIHTVRATLAAIEARLEKPESGKDLPNLVAILHLNKRESEAALDVLEKALKTGGNNPHLNFLKATALAQLGRADQSAEALQKAISVDSDLQVLFHLERDFDGVRYGSAFAAYERD